VAVNLSPHSQLLKPALFVAIGLISLAISPLRGAEISPNPQTVPVSKTSPLQVRFPAAIDVVRYSFSDDEDIDFDGLPDDWTRRRGAKFPHYVKGQIDRTHGQTDLRSLRFDADGGPAIYYSAPAPIDPDHAYIFRGAIRASKIAHTAACVSISLLNSRRQRVARYLTPAIVHSTDNWEEIEFGPIFPSEDVRYLVLGCHLVPGEQLDVSGSIWFDDLWVGKLPRMQIVSNFHAHFVNADAPIIIAADLSGLDGGHNYLLDLKLLDFDGGVIDSTQKTFAPQTASPPVATPAVEALPLASGPTTISSSARRIEWEIERQPPGHYRVTAELLRDGEVIVSRETSLAKMRLQSQLVADGDFGWSVREPITGFTSKELGDIAAQAGINWLKYPVWKPAADGDNVTIQKTLDIFDEIQQRGVRPVGVFSAPPTEIRAKFNEKWLGVSEVFRLGPQFWSQSLEPVLARYSSVVRNWQLGDDADTSFVGLRNIREVISAVRTEIQQISRGADIGVVWDGPYQEKGLLRETPNFAATNYHGKLTRSLSESATQPEMWVHLPPNRQQHLGATERAAGMVKQLIAARTKGFSPIFHSDVLDPIGGLLRPDGSPTELFLPWRSVVLSMRKASALGQFHFPNGSASAMFARDQKVTMLVWNAEPTIESFFVGDRIRTSDLWGRPVSNRYESQTGLNHIEVGPVPIVIEDCSEALVRWQMATRFERGRIRSEYVAQDEAIIGKNPFTQGVSGTVKLILPDGWEAEPRQWTLQLAAGEEFRLPTRITLAPNTNLGPQSMTILFDIVADRPYKFKIQLPYQVGLDDVTLNVEYQALPDGRLEIQQIVKNSTVPPEVLNFRCSLFVPGSRRQKLQVTKLGQGQDSKFYYLPNAQEVVGQELWLRLEQDGGRRVMNYRWQVGE
jgi:hypothetical protein